MHLTFFREVALSSGAVCALCGKRICRHLTCRTGKVRDIYDLGDKLLIVASIGSPFRRGSPHRHSDKGACSHNFLFSVRPFARCHSQSRSERQRVSRPLRSSRGARGSFDGRAQTQPLPIECVVRGYVSGSGWKDYCATGTFAASRCPAGLRESDRLPEPISPPQPKRSPPRRKYLLRASASLIGARSSERVRSVSIELYQSSGEICRTSRSFAGGHKIRVRLAEKFSAEDQLIWIDEALTPDSSRLWPAAQYHQAARNLPSTSNLYATISNALNGRRLRRSGATRRRRQRDRAKYREAYRIL